VERVEVILLDTHIWIWLVHDDPMPDELQLAFDVREDGDRLAVSVISCWEIAKLVEFIAIRPIRSSSPPRAFTTWRWRPRMKRFAVIRTCTSSTV
jgi:PIN domain nuclease of toxin-antitoxin system